MATKKDEAKTVKARVLADCQYGKVDEVVEVDPSVAEQSSELDAHPDAVKYAEGLKK